METKAVYINNLNLDRELTEREKAILRAIIQHYILNAHPVGSRTIAKYLENELKLSPATIRNIMADLEDMELITHPHTSAGRIPTDKGYRFYVNSLMEIGELNEQEKRVVNENLIPTNPEIVLKDASKIIGLISRYLGIVQIPYLFNLTILKIELIKLSQNKLLVVIAFDSNIVRTISLEANFDFDEKLLDSISSLINERLSGRKLQDIKENFAEIIADSQYFDTPIIRLFIDSVDKLFELYSATEKVHLSGTHNLLTFPEFADYSKIRGIIELVENEDLIVHLLEKTNKDIKVLIGEEMENELLSEYSLIASTYRIGSVSGSIGLIGPKRMDYSKMIALVLHISQTINNLKI